MRGLHCIAAGMHWAPTDMISLLKQNNKEFVDPHIKQIALNLDERKKIWENNFVNVSSLYNYLRENIHNENS